MANDDSWCIAARESFNDRWTLIEFGLPSRDAAEDRLSKIHCSWPEFEHWYIDIEDNEGQAVAYFDRCEDGSLIPSPENP